MSVDVIPRPRYLKPTILLHMMFSGLALLPVAILKERRPHDQD